MLKYLKKISAHWNDRPLSIEHGVKQILDFLKQLRAHNPIDFSHWYEDCGDNNLANLWEVDINYSAIKKIIIAKNFSDINLAADNELRYQPSPISNSPDHELNSPYEMLLNLCNGCGVENSSYLTICLGKRPGIDFFIGYCLLSLPIQGPTYTFYKKEENREEIIELFNNFWKPDYMIINKQHT